MKAPDIKGPSEEPDIMRGNKQPDIMRPGEQLDIMGPIGDTNDFNPDLKSDFNPILMMNADNTGNQGVSGSGSDSNWFPGASATNPIPAPLPPFSLADVESVLSKIDSRIDSYPNRTRNKKLNMFAPTGNPNLDFTKSEESAIISCYNAAILQNVP